VALRARVVEGRNIPYRVTFGGVRGGSRGTHDLRLEKSELVLEGPGGAVLRLPVPGGGGMTSWGGSGTSSIGGAVYLGREPIKPGPWTATFTLNIVVDGEPIQLSYQQAIEVVPRGQSTVKLVEKPELRNTLTVRIAAVKLGPPYRLFDREQRTADVTVYVDSLPMPLSFGVFALDQRPDGSVKEWKLASMAVSKPMGYGTSGQVSAEFDAERVTIVLRPDSEYAESTVDIFEIWNGEIELPDVVVERRGMP
jgi:hypothetical protein